MAGRYRKNPSAVRKRTNLTLDPTVWEKAQEICYAEGISVSEFVNRVLKEHVTEAEAEQFAAAKKRAKKKIA